MQSMPWQNFSNLVAFGIVLSVSNVSNCLILISPSSSFHCVRFLAGKHGPPVLTKQQILQESCMDEIGHSHSSASIRTHSSLWHSFPKHLPPMPHSQFPFSQGHVLFISLQSYKGFNEFSILKNMQCSVSECSVLTN